jgi:hypothetical protein
MFIFTGASLLYCLIAIFGFVGALSRKRTLVNAYNHTHAILLGISIVTGSILLWGMTHSSSQNFIDECIRKSDYGYMDACTAGFNAAKGFVIAISVIYWLLQLCKCRMFPYHPSSY